MESVGSFVWFLVSFLLKMVKFFFWFVYVIMRAWYGREGFVC